MNDRESPGHRRHRFRRPDRGGPDRTGGNFAVRNLRQALFRWRQATVFLPAGFGCWPIDPSIWRTTTQIFGRCRARESNPELESCLSNSSFRLC